MWLTRAEYVATVDYERVLATGWDHTEYEDVRSFTLVTGRRILQGGGRASMWVAMLSNEIS
ncbi:MAG TPA: hypothetical protein EYO94_10675 [Acidobacteria bacterium]|nr:hypothetical protein [Acidobacteriota bacterium]HIM14870.1 hypothetical protein [Acidobacteriota bacterium]